MRSFSARPGDIERSWVLIDAEGVVLGRLASRLAVLLRGKHRATYTPHMDCGDHVVVINAAKICLTGRKREDKIYYRHTGYPGGIKEERAGSRLEGRFPERVLMDAVRRMLPRGPLARRQLLKLHVYADAEHKHDAQNPERMDFAAAHPRNRGGR